MGAYRHLGWILDLFHLTGNEDWPPFFPITVIFGTLMGLMITGFYGLVGSFLGGTAAVIIDRVIHPITDKSLAAERAYSEPETTLAIISGLAVLVVGLAISRSAQSAVELGAPSDVEVAAAICISFAALSACAVFLIVKALKMGMAWLRAKRG